MKRCWLKSVLIRGLLFRGLEKAEVRFPSPGKIRVEFSKAWKVWCCFFPILGKSPRLVFQSLENKTAGAGPLAAPAAARRAVQK
jgi:hypothetical protein